MSSTPVPSRGPEPMHVVQVLGGGSAVTGAHVRSLTAGLVARGLPVTVCAPRGAELTHHFTGAGAQFAPASAQLCPLAVSSLRAMCAEADLVHAHGLAAGLLAVLALRDRRHRVPLVVTWHSGRRAEGGRAAAERLLERSVLRKATVVLGASTELVDLARCGGARDARLAPIAFPVTSSVPGTGSAAPVRSPWGHPRTGGPHIPAPAAAATPARPVPWPASAAPAARYHVAERERLRRQTRADLGAVGRPLLLAVGRLTPHQGYGTLLTASRAWRHLEPRPLLAIAGEGAERAALQRRIDGEDLPVRLLGRRNDALGLLAAADAAVLPGCCEARPLIAQEALNAGVPLVATAVSGVSEMVGDAAVLVPDGDPDALAEAVTRLLTDPARGAELAQAGRAQAAVWPTEEDTVAHVLSVYDELRQGQDWHRERGE